MTADNNCTNCRFALIRNGEYFCIAIAGTPVGIAREVILDNCERFEKVKE